nr:hypothetical protein [Tanacetum cinerariifolium]
LGKNEDLDGFVYIGEDLHCNVETVNALAWMKGTSEWKARPGERDVRMEGTPGWKGRPDGRHIQMKGKSG